MTSMREERLQERVAEIRPELAKARELAEKADAENRAMTPRGADDLTTRSRLRDGASPASGQGPNCTSPARRERSERYRQQVAASAVCRSSDSVVPKRDSESDG